MICTAHRHSSSALGLHALGIVTVVRVVPSALMSQIARADVVRDSLASDCPLRVMGWSYLTWAGVILQLLEHHDCRLTELQCLHLS